MRTKTQSIMIALSAAACVAAISPAAARGPSDVATVAPKTAGGAAAEKKICMTSEPQTGSRLRIRDCRTRAAWEADGYTVGSKSKAKGARR